MSETLLSLLTQIANNHFVLKGSRHTLTRGQSRVEELPARPGIEAATLDQVLVTSQMKNVNFVIIKKSNFWLAIHGSHKKLMIGSQPLKNPRTKMAKDIRLQRQRCFLYLAEDKSWGMLRVGQPKVANNISKKNAIPQPKGLRCTWNECLPWFSPFNIQSHQQSTNIPR